MKAPRSPGHDQCPRTPGAVQPDVRSLDFTLRTRVGSRWIGLGCRGHQWRSLCWWPRACCCWPRGPQAPDHVAQVNAGHIAGFWQGLWQGLTASRSRPDSSHTEAPSMRASAATCIGIPWSSVRRLLTSKGVRRSRWGCLRWGLVSVTVVLPGHCIEPTWCRLCNLLFEPGDFPAPRLMVKGPNGRSTTGRPTMERRISVRLLGCTSPISSRMSSRARIASRR